MIRTSTMIASLVVALTFLATAPFAQEVNNEGLIEQTVDLKGKIELKQDLTIGSVQGANLVAARDTVTNSGEIIQKVTAESAELDQDLSLASTQCLNCVIAGNPGTGIGF